ncbi:MAG: ABC transporter ATP-binding protein [Planctomycetes bacterium]|nr:ABC transporter ATP-binding protein [Planctomycetota bacterium]
MSESNAPALRVRGLYKFQRERSREVAILKDISFELPRGRFLAIMGPSGSGKTTLLHLLGGLETPSAGAVEIDGQDLAGLGERKRALLRREAVGFVFQFFHLVPNLSVRENVALPLRIRGQSGRAVAERVDALLTQFGLTAQAELLPPQLSGGEMQRVGVARAVIGEPALLLADEPTGNLATGQGEEVLRWLRRLHAEQGQSIVLVTHNPRDAAYADEVRFLVDGSLLAEPRLVGSDVDAAKIHACLRDLKI